MITPVGSYFGVFNLDNGGILIHAERDIYIYMNKRKFRVNRTLSRARNSRFVGTVKSVARAHKFAMTCD